MNASIKKNKFVKLMYFKLLGFLADANPKLGSRLIYFAAFKKLLNLKNPVDFNQKIMWLKLNCYYDNPLVTMCADKLGLREYAKKKIGDENNLPILYGSWKSAEDIDWDTLPEKFVMKCNHGCGYNIICRNKEEINFSDVSARLTEWMQEDYYKLHIETVYKFIPKRIICEEFLEDATGQKFLTDYKFYCFSGVPAIVLVCEERTKDHVKLTWFDMAWNIMDIGAVYSGSHPEKPACFDEMCIICETLSMPFPFVRIDLYAVNGKPYIGEMTFTPYAGVAKYYNKRGLAYLGGQIQLKDVGG